MKTKKPLQDIAAELGVSPAAVSFVLNSKATATGSEKIPMSGRMPSYALPGASVS